MRRVCLLVAQLLLHNPKTGDIQTRWRLGDWETGGQLLHSENLGPLDCGDQIAIRPKSRQEATTNELLIINKSLLKSK